MALPDKATREPLPVERSIYWLPLGDSQHIVAAMRPGANAVRIVVAQPVLRRLDSIARSTSTEREIGLLVGHVRHCPLSETHYMVIDALGEYRPSSTQGATIERALPALVDSMRRKPGKLLGWYHRGDGPPHRMASDEEAGHRAHFPEPWHPVLILRSNSRGASGTFLQHEMGGAASHAAPFYELIDPKFFRAHATKPTCIAWPNYIASEEVARLPRVDETDAPRAVPSTTEPRKPRWTLWSGLGSRNADAEPQPRVAHAPRPVHESRVEEAFRTGRDPARTSSAPHGVEPEATATHGGAPAPEPAPAADDSHRARSRGPRHTGTSDGRPVGSAPARYIEAARDDGFFVVAKFDAVADTGQRETLWVLHDPYCGLLLLIVASDSAVIDASLHYNLRADDSTFEATFSEYRDADTRTIYMRESCRDGLRARCERLRASGALEADWIVTPTIYLLTPSEWEATVSDDPLGGARTVQELNHRRMAALPEAVSRRFGLFAR